jgi:hypothetical protein
VSRVSIPLLIWGYTVSVLDAVLLAIIFWR